MKRLNVLEIKRLGVHLNLVNIHWLIYFTSDVNLQTSVPECSTDQIFSKLVLTFCEISN